ncbi:hypothetical protein KR222_006537 [Zaprionus bogoriensis]|nr:hypothetical protein KR222_006537 [Zaprionus bogoriensis]
MDTDKPIVVTAPDESIAFQMPQRITCISSLLSDAIDRVFKDVRELRQMLDQVMAMVKSNAPQPDEMFVVESQWQPILHYLIVFKNNWNTYVNVVLFNCEDTLKMDEINGIINILLGFEQAAQALQEETTPTLHMTIPHLHKLKKLCVHEDNDLHVVSVLKSALKSHLDRIASGYISKYHKIALFLFPPTKKLLLFDEAERNETLADCMLMMQQFYVEPDSPRKKLKVDNQHSADGIFSDFIEQTCSDSKVDAINHEINDYLSRKIALAEVDNVLQWWLANKVLFPLLYQVSCKILGTPGSIAPAQRAILQARTLLAANQTRVPCDETINEIVFLNYNYKYER